MAVKESWKAWRIIKEAMANFENLWDLQMYLLGLRPEKDELEVPVLAQIYGNPKSRKL
jgi:hypothetical protein